MIKYEVLVETPSQSVTVPVFTESKDKKAIKGKALIAASKFLKELGIEHDLKDLKPIGYKTCGSWEVMPNETV